MGRAALSIVPEHFPEAYTADALARGRREREPTERERQVVRHGLLALRAWFHGAEAAAADGPFPEQRIGAVFLRPQEDDKGRAAVNVYETSETADGAAFSYWVDPSSVLEAQREVAVRKSRLSKLVDVFDLDVEAGVIRAFKAAEALCLHADDHWETPYAAARPWSDCAHVRIDRVSRFYNHLAHALFAIVPLGDEHADVHDKRCQRSLDVVDLYAYHMLPPLACLAPHGSVTRAHSFAWGNLSAERYAHSVAFRRYAFACLWRNATAGSTSPISKKFADAMRLHARCPACGVRRSFHCDWDRLFLADSPALFLKVLRKIVCLECGMSHCGLHMSSQLTFEVIDES